jgi:putative cell wall-binding protein
MLAVVSLLVVTSSLLVGVSTAAAAPATTPVNMANFAFQPDPVQVEPGDTVTWTNKDAEPHTATADDGSFSVLVNPGETKSVTFASAGSFAYYCKFHGGPGGQGMSGTVRVGTAAAPATVNLDGTDNVARAIAWSAANHPDGSAFAVLGRADLFADSLASGAVQGKLGGPLLLTAPNALDARTKAELDRLKTRTVYLMGGTGAISTAVETALRNSGRTVRRLAGSDRLATAAAAADAVFPEATSALLVRAFGPGTAAFADALGSGALAATSGRPILFSDTGSLSAATKGYLQSHPITSVSLVGGTAALSDQVENDLKALNIETDRLAGGTRFETAEVVAQAAAPPHGPPDALVFVDGVSDSAWADGFAAAGRKAPVLLVSGDTVPGNTAHFVANAGDPAIGFICGPTVSDVACSRVDKVRTIENLDFPKFGAVLDGKQRPGDTTLGAASGVYKVSDPGALCYDYTGSPIDATAAHIHRVSDGTIAIPFDLASNSDGRFGCTFGLDPALVADVFANPADYYINIHTPAFPSGAISGTMTHVTEIGLAAMTSEAEVPGPGDKDGAGFGFVFLTDTPGQVCAGVLTFGLSSPATAAHIHQAPSGQSGPVVVTLVTPTETAVPVNCYPISDSLASSMKANPGGFYMNVHTESSPDGAIRGNLYKV